MNECSPRHVIIKWSHQPSLLRVLNNHVILLKILLKIAHNRHWSGCKYLTINSSFNIHLLHFISCKIELKTNFNLPISHCRMVVRFVAWWWTWSEVAAPVFHCRIIYVWCHTFWNVLEYLNSITRFLTTRTGDNSKKKACLRRSGAHTLPRFSKLNTVKYDHNHVFENSIYFCLVLFCFVFEYAQGLYCLFIWSASNKETFKKLNRIKMQLKQEKEIIKWNASK